MEKLDIIINKLGTDIQKPDKSKKRTVKYSKLIQAYTFAQI